MGSHTVPKKSHYKGFVDCDPVFDLNNNESRGQHVKKCATKNAHISCNNHAMYRAKKFAFFMEIHWRSRLIGSKDVICQIIFYDFCIRPEQFMRLGPGRTVAIQKNITRN